MVAASGIQKYNTSEHEGSIYLPRTGFFSVTLANTFWGYRHILQLRVWSHDKVGHGENTIYSYALKTQTQQGISLLSHGSVAVIDCLLGTACSGRNVRPPKFTALCIFKRMACKQKERDRTPHSTVKFPGWPAYTPPPSSQTCPPGCSVGLAPKIDPDSVPGKAGFCNLC